MYPPEVNQNHLFNALIIFSGGHMCISTGAFFLFKAESLYEYGSIYNVSFTTLAALFQFITNFYRMGDILELIAKFEEFIRSSERYLHFNRIN